MAYPQAWFQRNANGQVIGSYSQVPIPKDGTPTWLPLIPEGQFVLELEDGTEVVDIRHEYLEEMVANFRSGFPGPAGVPVDQRADHSRNPEGAYAFYKDLKIDDGGLWGLFTPTELGKDVISSGALPYVSPVFSIGDAPDPVWGRRNILIDAALCTQPQFGGQPQMVLASAYAPSAAPQTTEAASAADSHEGVSDMAEMTAEELQTKIDEAVAAAKAEWEQAQADAAKEKNDRLAELQSQIEELQAKAGDAEALQRAFDELKQKQAEADAEARLAEATREFEAVRKEAIKVLPDGSEQVDVLALAPEAVKIAAAAKANPQDSGAAAALTAHVLQFGGFEMVTVSEGKPNLVKAAAPPPAAQSPVGQLDLPEDCRTFIASRVAQGVTAEAAYFEYCRNLLPT